jgi:gamma-glutamyltranspeptidase/glutathione hydrolase
MKFTGAVACGHAETSASAVEILRAGGNAFDAVIAAVFTACVAEPMLCSLGGGGFLLARENGAEPRLVDFFTQTPASQFHGDADFYPIMGNFGEQLQEFHIGLGSMAVPGVLRGLLHIHERYASMPLTDLMAQATQLARDGLALNDMQAYILEILKPIVAARDECRSIFIRDGETRAVGETITMPDFADFLELLAKEGGDLFYRGEPARRMSDDCARTGGHLGLEDLANYEVIERDPIAWTFAGAKLWSNPPPSSGGLLIAYATRLFETARAERHSNKDPMVRHFIMAQAEANRLRGAEHLVPAELLADSNITAVLAGSSGADFAANRGTTHISIIDGEANAASLTISNGEGCGYMVPGTGVMMNNMLGEEDLNPDGFGTWPPDTRLRSMMSPTIAESAEGKMLVLGSGGSNRIRSALFQALVRRLFLQQDLDEVILSPRVHLEGSLLNIEDFNWPEASRTWMIENAVEHQLWPQANLFFGGVHAVELDLQSGSVSGFGDPRRDGHFQVG